MPPEGPHTRTGAHPLRRRLYVVLEAGKTADLPSLLFDGFMVALILANVAAFALQTVPEVDAVYGAALYRFEIFSIAIFTLEYLARLWVAVDHPHVRHLAPLKARARWAVIWPMLIDLAVIAPFYLSFLFFIDLRVLRVFRLLRFLKLARFSPALATIGRVVMAEGRAILGALIIMAGLLMSSATAMYWIEGEAQPDLFGSVPEAMWWAIATLTTVGYGDAVPVTVLGKLVGGLVMFLGLGMFALPIAIISSGFAQEIHRRDFVVNWDMVARVPLFKELDPYAVSDLLKLLQSQILPAGTFITQRGEESDGMYFILLGQARAYLPGGVRDLSEGDYFGQMALLDEHERAATVEALTRCHVLKLSRPDFNRFISRHESAFENIRMAALAEEDEAGEEGDIAPGKEA